MLRQTCLPVVAVSWLNATATDVLGIGSSRRPRITAPRLIRRHRIVGVALGGLAGRMSLLAGLAGELTWAGD